MDLVLQFKEQNRTLFATDAKYLLAVSGGVDSMVLLDLCIKNNLNIAIAHCNFSLRDEESIRDEKFVRGAANKYNIEIFVETFDTQKIASELKLSIQETARNLRYSFFDELIKKHHFKHVLTAHHQNDSAETVFINLLRGTGIKGLAGIKKQRNTIYRPLLFAMRNNIVSYATKNNIAFVEDSSNKKDDYLRNNIRHNLVPELENIDKNAIQKILKSANYIEQEVTLHEWFLNKWIEENCIKNGNTTTINLKNIENIPNASLLIKHLLKPDNVGLIEIEKFLQSNTGAVIQTSTMRVLKNRDELIFENIQNAECIDTEYIFENTTEISGLKLEYLRFDSDYFLEKDSHIAQLDSELLKFPLTLRKWKHGDEFQPFGMKGKKLLSDYLINNKVNLFDKEKVRVIESNGTIIWVVGMRIDNRFAISSSTKKIVKITLITAF